MSPSVKNAFDAALALTEHERRELIEAIVGSFPAASQPPFDPSWGPVVQGRSEELANGEVKTLDWEQVKRSARGAVGE